MPTTPARFASAGTLVIHAESDACLQKQKLPNEPKPATEKLAFSGIRPPAQPPLRMGRRVNPANR